jgi:hypothetical protein
LVRKCSPLSRELCSDRPKSPGRGESPRYSTRILM